MNMNNIELNQNIIEKPYNPTDPITKFDPTFKRKTIVKEYDDPNKSASTSTFNSLKDDGINIPVVRLNNITLNKNQIDQVIINYNSFFPTVHLSIKDTENVIKICDAPGFDNEIHIVIICQLDGYYKKIDLLFYITNFFVDGDYISYDGIFKLQSLNSHVMKQIGKGKLNTYQMLYEIAKENKLGFAATEKCEEIKDERYRLIQSKTYVDYINEQLSFAGLDENSIFDAWIDLFGYIKMVNVSYILNKNVNPKNLTINAIYGGKNIMNDENAGPKAILAQRTLTNYITDTANTNLHFQKFETFANYDNIYQNGSLNTGWYMSSPCKENKINNEQVQLIENSEDGMNYSTEYEYGRYEFLGIDFGDPPMMAQKKINSRFFEKIRAKRIQIELQRYNLGLDRGILVNIIFQTTDEAVIKILDPENVIKETIDGAINYFATGMYYIDSMQFSYIPEEDKIKQHLILIKKGIDNKPLSKTKGPNLD